VAPFEVDAPPGAAVPDVATLLAARLDTRGVQRVVGPAQLGALPDVDAEPVVVKGWASEAEVDAVVVGRTTQIGNQLSVDVRLRAGGTGEVARTLIEQFPRSEDLEGGVDHLAGEVIAATARLLEAPAPAVAARGPAPPAGDGPAPFGFDFGGGDEPLAIESEELEVVQKDGRRRLVFSKNVRVRQGELQLSSALLEAVYPDDGGQPDRLVAEGDVQLAQGNQKAHCDRLDYDRLNERLVCRGNAWFQDGENRLSGEVIHIDLRADKVKVKGGATVLIQPVREAGGGRTS
jgi:lipopolysaccharide export system protein LptA